MCLGVPGKLVEITEEAGLRMGKVDFGGVYRQACLEYIPEAKLGDYVVVHVGFAISLLSEAEAAATLEVLDEVCDLKAELNIQSGEVTS